MTQNPNHICQICGTKYYACDNCDKIGSWKKVACSHNCFKVYVDVTDSRCGVLNQSESIERFAELGITIDNIDTYENLSDTVRNQIKGFIKTNDDSPLEISETVEVTETIETKEIPFITKTKLKK